MQLQAALAGTIEGVRTKRAELVGSGEAYGGYKALCARVSLRPLGEPAAGIPSTSRGSSSEPTGEVSAGNTGRFIVAVLRRAKRPRRTACQGFQVGARRCVWGGEDVRSGYQTESATSASATGGRVPRPFKGGGLTSVRRGRGVRISPPRLKGLSV